MANRDGAPDEHPREFIRRYIQKMVTDLKQRYGVEARLDELPASELPKGLDMMDLTAQLKGVDPKEDTPELKAEMDAIENDMKQRAAILLSGTDLKQAIKDQVVEAHELMHRVGDRIGMIAYLTAQLEPDPENDGGEEISKVALTSFQQYVMGLGLRMVDAGCNLCAMFHSLDKDKPIPGKHRDATGEPDDFEEFMQKVHGQPSGNA